MGNIARVLLVWVIIIVFYLVNILKDKGDGAPAPKSAKKSLKAASSLTCLEGIQLDDKPNSDFASYDIDNITTHEKKDYIIDKLKELFDLKQEKINESTNDPEILACQAEIAKRLRRIYLDKRRGYIIFNEATVYGDPIVDMIIDSFQYKLQIEETVGTKEDSQVCCWRLYKNNKSACIAVLETKHEKSIPDKNYAQLLGYYCYNTGSVDRTGIAILLNEFGGKVTVRFFIFPYRNSTTCGLQAILLPKYECKSDDVIKGRKFLELIYFFCKDCDVNVPYFTCPEKIIGRNDVVKVQTETEYIDSLHEEIQSLLEEKQSLIQEAKEAKEKAKEATEKAKEEKKQEKLSEELLVCHFLYWKRRKVKFLKM